MSAALRLGLALALAGAALAARAERLPPAADLARDAGQARAVLILFTLPGCHYCEAVREAQLLPMLRDPALRGRVALREIDITSEKALRDFSGAASTQRAFSQAHQVRIAPTVMAFDPAGKPLGAPIVGAKTPEFYGHYLDRLLAPALAR